MSFPLPYLSNPNPYFAPHPASYLDMVPAPSPVYTILIIGMVLFIAANIMPNLLPAADRVWNVAPMVLQWGFVIIIFALCVQMLGIMPGVPPIHITYVHMTVATLLFVIMWNHIASDIKPAAEEKRSSSSSRESSSEKKEEKKREEKKKDEEEEPSPWDDLRAHPSAFLTTRLNKMLPWPFPMGRAERTGIGLWWESGMPLHVGHYNRPDPEAAKKAVEAEKQKSKKEKEEKEKGKEKDKEKEKEKEKEKAKEKEKVEKERAEKEAALKAKTKEEEVKKAKEAEKARLEAAKKKAVEDRQKQKLWRTKCLAIIIGISFLNKTLAFLLLLFFSLQMVSQQLNEEPAQSMTEKRSSSSSSSTSVSSGRASSLGDEARRAEKEKMVKLQAAKEKEKEKAGSSSSSSKPSSSSATRSDDEKKEKRPSTSSSSSSSKDKQKEGSSSSSSSSSKEKDRSSSSSTSSSSSSKSSSGSGSSSSKKDEPIGSEAIRKAAGSKTVTHVDPGEEGFGVPYQIGFGMHYIHTADSKDRTKLDMPSMFIPSEGMAHPLMTTTYRQYAN